MNYHTSWVAAVAAAALALGGCQSWEYGEKETAGTVIGGVGGAVLGSQVGDGSTRLVATAAGTLIGAWIGNEVGKSLDRADQQHAERSANAALERNPDGQATTWTNPNTGHAGATTPVRTYETAQGPCREYQTSVVIDGRTQTAYGTACREPDGTWRVVN
ncbi:MAG TPA: RT0821/Lpp0805 family surface protein [Alphaproteobacteria bacterium]|nr:RT0821/Lpp0805 family surface protein [Alphaproteobacteria bacterium]